MSKENPNESNTNEKVIVSCSSLIELKRVNLIVEILKNTTSKIKWVHFGDGPLLSSVKEKTKELGNNISVEFKGYVSHDQILKYYKENRIDLFMNVSELEGIPVSIMEAISFGIPVTGCNICGVPEIVTKETGFLWDVNFDVKAAANELENYFQSTEQRKQDLRTSAKNYWAKHFDADKNYKSFIKDCLLN
ncbi:MAG: glycosyltransferase [Sphingobacteriaceae bacterium]|nr:glycosyltransferase [Sphingobacteriaceae bacterium]